MSNEVHRKTDAPFPGNNMTVAVAETEPLTIRSGDSSSNHYATLEESNKGCKINKYIYIYIIVSIFSLVEVLVTSYVA